MDDTNKCKGCACCGTDGFKCDMCGDESATFDEKHVCGGENCQPKCSGCRQAEGKCDCK